MDSPLPCLSSAQKRKARLRRAAAAHALKDIAARRADSALPSDFQWNPFAAEFVPASFQYHSLHETRYYDPAMLWLQLSQIQQQLEQIQLLLTQTQANSTTDEVLSHLVAHEADAIAFQPTRLHMDDASALAVTRVGLPLGLVGVPEKSLAAADCTSSSDITPTRSCVAIAINEFYDVACEVRQRLPHIPCDYSIKWSRAPPLLLHQCMLTDTLPNPDNLDEASSAVTPVGLPLGLVGVSMASLLNQSCTVAFRDAPAISDVPDRAPTRSRSAITVNEFYGVAREVRKRLPYISCHYSIKWSRTPPLLLHQCMLTDTPPRHARLTGVLGDARHAEGSPIQMLQHVAQPSCRLSRARDVLEQLAESQPILRDCCIIVNDFGIIYAENKAPYVRTSSQALQGFACVCTSTLALAVLSGGDEEPPFVTCASCRRHAGGQVILRLMTTEAPTLQNFVGDWEDSNGFQAKVAYPCWYIGRRRRKYLNVALMGSSMQRTMQLREDSSRFLCGPAYLDLDCYSPDLLRWIFPDGSDCYWRRCKSDTTPKTAEVIPENQSQLPDKFPVGCQRRTPRRQSQTSVTTRIHAGGTRRRKGKTKRPKTSCRSRHTGPMPAAARGDRSVKS
eukprot:TRINITY_DN14210_c0_g1_i2.p1 TRINITY_DN14210_c0_g1~~TRINITY_DN14210_c0_g1_i2.p1  ORF type:complete len:618 (-),score=63.21 TRINITY_DN14210_c0_g1_i2:138-1991(-)